MKKMLQPRKKLATFATLLCLMTMMPLTALAEVINTVTSSETITKTSTVYVGEVVVDGESKIKYLYSGDINLYRSVIQNLLDGLNGMADGDYAALLEEHEFDYGSQTTGFAICSNPDLVATMDGNWSSAQYVGTLYYPDKTVTSEINSNLYDIDEGFKAVLDSKTQYRIENIDTPADAEKCIVTQIDLNSNSSVYYTVEDGEIIKHVDTHVVFLSEATTVIYTKVELTSGSTSTVMGDVNGDGTVTIPDVSLMVAYILGQQSDDFIEANADANGDGSSTVSDVTVLVENILNGNGGNGGNDNPDNPDNPPYTLSCPDDNHPHMIDLGLPSGTKWACCNVADNPANQSPTCYGGYYAWGETWEKAVYNDVTYQHSTGVDDDGDGWYDDYHPETGVTGVLQIHDNIAGSEYDVAHVKWGGKWQIPVPEQFKELVDLNNCDYKWTTINGTLGGLFISKYNNASIFLPAASYRYGFDTCEIVIGNYWTGSFGVNGLPYALEFDVKGADWQNNNYLSHGLSVRPVWVP